MNDRPNSLLSDSQLADELGRRNAELSKLTDEVKALKAEVQARVLEDGHGENTILGELFKATVSVFDRTTTDWKKIAEKLNPSTQLITAHTKTKEIISVRPGVR